jgi:hypothetical protein
LLFFAHFHRAPYFQGRGLNPKIALQGKKIFAVLHLQGIAPVKCAFGEAEVMNSVQDIRFSTSILPQQAIYPRTKDQLGVAVILKLDELEGLQDHVFVELFDYIPDF